MARQRSDIAPRLRWAIVTSASLLGPTACTRPPLDPLPPCVRLWPDRLPGPEDLEVISAAGSSAVVIVSASARRCQQDTSANGIYRATIEDGREGELVRLAPTPDNSRALDPHGLSYVTSHDGRRHLSVISHPVCGTSGEPLEGDAGDGVDVYELTETAAHIERRVAAPEGSRLNDIVALPDGTFYASDTKHGRVLHGRWDTETSQMHVARQSLRFPNGVAVDGAGTSVFVAELFRRRILRFTRTPTTGALRPRGDPIATHGYPDNLMWGDDGLLYVASHASIPRFLLHMSGVTARSPSLVEVIDTASGEIVRRLRSDEDARATSTAIRRDGHLYLGQVYEGGILQCEL